MPVSLLLLASASAVLWLGLAVLLGSVIVGGTVFFLRARFQERLEAEPSSRTSAVPVESEVRAIGEQIEWALREQRLQGETQRQILAQKLDSVRQSVEAQRNQVEGLQNELRHEVRRRDTEMETLRRQLGEAPGGGPLPPPATPSLLGDGAPEAVGSTPPSETTDEGAATAGPSAFRSVFEEVSPGTASGDGAADAVVEAAIASPAPDRAPVSGWSGAGGTFEDVAFPSPALASTEDGQSTPAAEPPPSLTSVFEDWIPAGSPLAEIPVAEPLAAAPEAPAELATAEPDSLPVAPADEFFGPDMDSDLPLPEDPAPEPEAAIAEPEAAVNEAPAPEALPSDPTSVAEGGPAPKGADDLTVISTIDKEIQERLYAEGVTTLDEIACWGHSDARRIGAAIDVPEDTIMNRWVFEAQAAIFDNAQ